MAKTGFGTANRPLRGVAYMVLGCALVSLNDAAVKYLTGTIPVGELIALRAVVVLAMIPILARHEGGLGSMRVHNLRGQSIRAGLMLISMLLFVTCLRWLPLADAIALLFAGPLFATALAVPMLGERVGWRRWSAVLVGFVGVLVIVRPGGAGFTWIALIPIVVAVLGAIRDILTRRLCGSESSTSILLVTTVFMIVGGSLTAPFGWVMPDAFGWGLLLVAGVLLGASQFLMIEAFRFSEIGFVVPFRYTSIVWAVAFGFIFFGAVPDAGVMIGSIIVVGSGLYILHRERVKQAA